MSTGTNQHLEEELLEKYAVGALADADTLDVEQHLFVCNPCRGRLAELEKFITGLRGLRHGSDASPMDEVHLTDSGPVHLLVRKSQLEGWTALLAAGGVEKSETFDTAFEANGFLRRRFRKEFPGHRCLQQCRSTRVPPLPGRA
jgi:hypothetical protein